MNATDYSPLTLIAHRNGIKYGTFTFEGHEITVAVQPVESGKFNYVRACSDTHPAFPGVLKSIGMLRKEGVGRYLVRQGGGDEGYVDHGTVADLAERLVRYSAQAGS